MTSLYATAKSSWVSGWMLAVDGQSFLVYGTQTKSKIKVSKYDARHAAYFCLFYLVCRQPHNNLFVSLGDMCPLGWTLHITGLNNGMLQDINKSNKLKHQSVILWPNILFTNRRGEGDLQHPNCWPH